MIAFTSGTTGKPEGHDALPPRRPRDLRHVLRKSVPKPSTDDVFSGTPPLAFTFGLGGLLCFPLRVGAAALQLEKATPELLLSAIDEHRATICFTAPTAYRAMTPLAGKFDLSSLTKCVSAGEALPAGDARGVEAGDRHRDHRRHRRDRDAAHLHRGRRRRHPPGATGKGRAGLHRVRPRRSGQAGSGGRRRPAGGERPDRLPLSRRRAAEELRAERLERHRRRLRDGRRRLLLVPGAHRRHDHLGGLQHRRPRGRVRAARARRGGRMRRGRRAPTKSAARSSRRSSSSPRGCEPTTAHGEGAAGPREGATIAPYKYPRAIEFVDALPRTETGKLQRFKLRQGAAT